MGWLRYRLDGVPYSIETAAFYLGSLACVILPAWFVGKPRAETEDWGRPDKRQTFASLAQFCISAFALVGVIGLYFYARREYAGVDVSSMRGERSNLAVSGLEARVYLLLSPFALASVVFWLKQKLPIKVFCAAAFLVLFWKASIISGARFELMPIPLLGALGLWFGYSDRFLKYPVRTILAAGTGFLFVLAVNSFYNILSTKGGGESSVAAYIRNAGAAVFELVGIRQAPIVLEEIMGSMAEYVFAPLIYLDFYLKENQFTPTMGTHQFAAIFVRLGFEEAIPTKMAVDDLYSAMGIYHNVWATGLREVMIDFGLKGALLQCLGMGLLLGASKRFLTRSTAARNLYLILCAYHLATPLVSLFKSKVFEIGFYGAVIWFLLDVMFRQTAMKSSVQRVPIGTGSPKGLSQPDEALSNS